jgi:subtilisin family serine protease
MPDACVVAVCQDPCEGYRFWNQISRPADRTPIAAARYREGVESSHFSRWFNRRTGYTIIIAVSDGGVLGSPCALGVPGKSMYKHDALRWLDRLGIEGWKEAHSRVGSLGSKRTVSPASETALAPFVSFGSFIALDRVENQVF